MGNTITLTLSVQEVNQILGALGQAPFVQVVELVGKVKQQAEAQVNQQPAAPAAE
jgi:hypothetical protein